MNTLTVADLKDYVFCPVIPWIKRFIGYEEPETRSMRIAREETDSSYKERVAEKLNLPKPWRVEVYARDPDTGLVGVVDLVAGEKRVVVAEIKRFSRRRVMHFRTQLLAYAYLINKTMAPVNKAVLVLEERVRLETPVTKQHLETIEKTIKKLKQTLQNEQPPPTNTEKTKCLTCQYRRLCPKTET
jgi:CRISPR-associated exonuclease Cas4